MSSDQPIVIKKVKKGGGHGHHGGAWKVAYADFVTAMMAFFLMMWLINNTEPEQRRALQTISHLPASAGPPPAPAAFWAAPALAMTARAAAVHLLSWNASRPARNRIRTARTGSR
jgi:flagellar motor protein MotB